VWLLAEWPPKEPEPTKYWLSNMDTITPLKTLVRLAKIRWRVEHHYRELKTGLGLDHVEGRSFIGCHRHVTLVCLAQAFCTLLRLNPAALRRPDPLRRPPRTATVLAVMPGACPIYKRLFRDTTNKALLAGHI